MLKWVGIIVFGLLMLAVGFYGRSVWSGKSVEQQLAECRYEFLKLQPNNSDAAKVYEYVTACMQTKGFKRSQRDDVCYIFEFISSAPVCWMKRD